MTRRVLHPNEGWLTMYLETNGRVWQTHIEAMAKKHFNDYTSARKYFDEHPKEFWWNDNDTVGINDHERSERLNANRTFFLDHPDPDGA